MAAPRQRCACGFTLPVGSPFLQHVSTCAWVLPAVARAARAELAHPTRVSEAQTAEQLVLIPPDPNEGRAPARPKRRRR